jgi:hypothetical protein
MPLARYLRLKARLKLTLTVRWLQRNQASAVATGLSLAVLCLALVAGALLLGIYLRTAGQTQRDAVLAWVLWIGTLLWLFAPLSQFDAQRNLDLSGLRLLPISRLRFTLSVLLDALLSPLGALSGLACVLLSAAFAQGAAEFFLLLPTLLLLGLFQLGCSQALYLLGNHIFTSRRWGELSMALGLLFFMGIQLLNLLLHSGTASLPPWLGDLLVMLRALLMPLGTWLAPGVAARAFAAGGQGWVVSALQLYLLLAAQAGAALLLAAWAARRFYEGELESGGSVRTRRQPLATARRRLAAGHWHGLSFPPLLAALLERERAYLWRDPLVKLQLLQSLFGSLYVAVVAFSLNLQQAAQPHNYWLERGGRYVLLGVALMLGLSESAILFNKFGYEGGQLANLLATPASRRTLLASKSIHLVGHFLPLNLALAFMAGLALHAPPLFIALALLLTVSATCCSTAWATM